MSKIQRSLAVVIGINQYINNIPALKTAVNDATKLAQILETKYQYQVLILLDTAATYDQLTHLLTAFEKQILPLADGSTTQIDESDRILFYFAGHGIALDALDNADGPTGFLVPQDARMDNDSSLLSMQKLHNALQKLPCRHLLVILDCCFAGAFRWAGNRDAVRRSRMYRERYQRFISGCAQQVITSAAHDEKAVDFLYRFGQRSEDFGNSPFAELLLKALSGKGDLSRDGVITATEIYVYIHSELGKTNAKQIPGFCQLKGHDKGEYIFAIPGFDPNNLATASALDENTNPYRGLESFEEKHSELFFGRKALVQKLQEFMINKPLTVVLGASGSGKSSLVKAGLIPQLKQSQQLWRILAPIRPGESPFTALNNTLLKENLPVFAKPRETFEQDLQTLNQTIKPWYEAHPDTKLLLFIDQFEELVTLCRDDDEQNKFLSGLARAIKAFPEQLRIVVTLRSDFEPQFRDTALEPYWSAGRFVVPAMTLEELRSAITEPATSRVMYFEPPSLVEQLIDEVVQMPGALPLLSFALSELYLKYLRSAYRGKRNNRAITIADYEELGGVTGSLTQRADEEYNELVKLDPAYAQTIKHVMLRMVAVGGGELARRRVFLPELEYPEPENTRVKSVIEHFVAARLLVRGRDTENHEYVEPAHDALVRGWQRLLNWKKQELASLLLQRELTPTVNKWATYRWDKQAVGLLWENDPRLPLLKQLSKSDQSWLNFVESEFVERSIQRGRNNLYRLISSVAGVILALSGLSIFAFDQRQVALQEEIKALTSSNDQLGSLIAIVKASRQLKHVSCVNKRLCEQSLRTFRQVVYDIQEHNRLEGHEATIASLSFSPDGKTIATASKDKTVKLWSLDGQLLKTLKGHTLDVLSVSFSPDGKTIATASQDKTVILWSLDGQLLKTLTGHGGWVWDVSFSPDGKTIATASQDKTVKLWSLDGQPIKTLKPHTLAVLSVSFSPDSKTIATASQDKTVKLLSLVDGLPLQTLRGHRIWVWDLSFSPDGKTIATASQDKTVILWSTVDGHQLQTPMVSKEEVRSVSFSPDGKTIATASKDGTVTLWSMDGKELTTLRGHKKGVYSVRFSPDGKTIASASGDGTAKLWSLDNQQLKTYLKGHQDWVTDVSFSPDGKTIATASKDTTVKLWNLNGQLLKTLKGHTYRVSRVRFSPDGRLLATASWDSTVKLWRMVDGQLLKTLKGHNNAVVNSVSFSPDGKIIATASGDGTAKLWRMVDGKELQTLKGHSSGVWDVRFSPDGRLLATASEDGTAKLWRIVDGQLLKTLPSHTDVVLSVSFSPDSKTIATANWDGTAKLFRIVDGQLLKTLPSHTDVVLSVSFSPDGKTIATASKDGTTKLWRMEDGEELQTLRGNSGDVLSVSFSPDGKKIATANLDSSVILWQLDVDIYQLGVIACNLLSDYLQHNPNVEKRDRQLCKLSREFNLIKVK